LNTRKNVRNLSNFERIANRCLRNCELALTFTLSLSTMIIDLTLSHCEGVCFKLFGGERILVMFFLLACEKTYRITDCFLTEIERARRCSRTVRYRIARLAFLLLFLGLLLMSFDSQVVRSFRDA
jgi:hypothetical protein